jgi:hypothetical protein
MFSQYSMDASNLKNWARCSYSANTKLVGFCSWLRYATMASDEGQQDLKLGLMQES